MKLENFQRAKRIQRAIKIIKESKIIERLTEAIDATNNTKCADQEPENFVHPAELLYGSGLCEMIPYELTLTHLREARDAIAKRLVDLENQFENL